MTTYVQGSTQTLVAQFYEYSGGPLADVFNLTLTISPVLGGAAILGPTSSGIVHPATGTYSYSWAVGSPEPGQYLLLWTGSTAAVSGTAVSASEVVTIVSSESSSRSFCEGWDPTWTTCALPTGSYSVTGTAVEIAAEILYGLSGRQFGLCTTTLRPCRDECSDGFPLLGTGYPAGMEPGYPTPLLVGGRWYNTGCGSCSGTCTCGTLSEVTLPGPVYSVTQVKVDGVVLTAGTDYRLDDYRRLVRINDLWPLCNDLNKADTEVGTWSVTIVQGQPLPALGRAALGVLAAEFAKLLVCDDSCALPKPVQSISRQGVNITFLDPNELFADGRTGLYVVDLFIQTYNPNKLRRPSRAYDIDRPYPRRTGTG